MSYVSVKFLKENELKLYALLLTIDPNARGFFIGSEPRGVMYTQSKPTGVMDLDICIKVAPSEVERAVSLNVKRFNKYSSLPTLSDKDIASIKSNYSLKKKGSSYCFVKKAVPTAQVTYSEVTIPNKEYIYYRDGKQLYCGKIDPELYKSFIVRGAKQRYRLDCKRSPHYLKPMQFVLFSESELSLYQGYLDLMSKEPSITL